MAAIYISEEAAAVAALHTLNMASTRLIRSTTTMTTPLKTTLTRMIMMITTTTFRSVRDF